MPALARARTTNARLPAERYAELAESEQFLLTITENGYGKRSSTYEYRRTNRGGQGITNIVTRSAMAGSWPASRSSRASN